MTIISFFELKVSCRIDNVWHISPRLHIILKKTLYIRYLNENKYHPNFYNFEEYSSFIQRFLKFFFTHFWYNYPGEEIEIGLVEINPVESLNTVTLRSNKSEIMLSDLMDTGGKEMLDST